MFQNNLPKLVRQARNAVGRARAHEDDAIYWARDAIYWSRHVWPMKPQNPERERTEAIAREHFESSRGEWAEAIGHLLQWALGDDPK